MDLERKPPRLSQEVLFREVDGEAVLLDLDSGRYYGLDPVGCRVWQLLAGGASLAGLVSALLEEFEVSREVLVSDLEELFAELAQAGLLVGPDLEAGEIEA